MKPSTLGRLGLTLLLLGGAWLHQAAIAQTDIVIVTGKEGGGYHTIGQRLKGVLSELKLSAEVLTSAGSIENITRLADPADPANVGLAQSDALKYYLIDHPEFAEQYLALGEIGQECVLVITGKDTGIEDDGDLQKDKGNLIAVQSPDSGVAVTYEYMTRLEPKFKNTAPAFVDGIEGLMRIKSGTDNLKAVMLVQRPKAQSDEMRAFKENPEDFRLVPITDWDLNDKLPDGSAVYSFETVTLEEKKWGFDTKVDTICTQGLMLAAPNKMTEEQRSRLSKAMLLAGKRILSDGD